MMTPQITEQILQSMFNIQGFYISNVSSTESEIILQLDSNIEAICPICSKPFLYEHDKTKRTIYAGTINLKAVYIQFYQYRGKCKEHKVVTEQLPFLEGKNQHINIVGETVIEYTKHLDNSSVSKLLGISKSKVYRIDRHYLLKLKEEYLEKVPFIEKAGVDEVSVRKGHSYGTVFINQADSRVVWIEQERTKESYLKILDYLKPKLGKLETVSMDFWKAFETGTLERFPYVRIVYDRFHLSQILNRHIEEERRFYQKSLPDEERKIMKKHSRWILLKRRKI